MLWIDWCFLAAVILSMALGLWRGLAHEAIALTGWVAAFFIARIFHTSLAEHLTADIQPYDAKRAIAWTALFFFVLLFFYLLAWIVRHFIAKSPLAVPDRFFGMAFGLLRGLAMCAAFVVLASAFSTLPSTAWWDESRFIAPLQTVAAWFLDVWQNHATTVLK